MRAVPTTKTVPVTIFGWFIVSLALPASVAAAKLQPQTLQAWDEYKRLTEARIQRELESSDGLLVRDFLEERDRSDIRSSLASGDIFVKKLTTSNEEGGKIKIPKGLVHHWYGILFLPGTELDAVLAWSQDYDNRQNEFENVEESRLLSRRGDVFEIFLRLRQEKMIKVHYNTEHRVIYRRIDEDAATSRSESTRIAELKDAGTDGERERPVGNDRGFLWRLASYWRFQQTSEGVVVECESISLSRTFPWPLRWFVRPLLDSVPRESLEAALRPMHGALAEAEKPTTETAESQK